MTSQTKAIVVSISSIAGGIIGVALASPVSYTLYESIPGQGYSRNCSPGDVFCNEQRSREIYSGQSYGTRAIVDDEETLQKQVVYGAIGVAAGGLVSFGLTTALSRKSEQE